jgi:hypothetical protein
VVQQAPEYQLLNAMKELIISQSGTESGITNIRPFVNDISALLFEYVRNLRPHV